MLSLLKRDAQMVEIHMKWAQGADRKLGLPRYQSLGAAGADLQANFLDRGRMVLAPGARRAIPTGLHMAIPGGYEGQVRPRSGLALRKGLTVVNAPGTIDSDYRGQVHVLLINLGAEVVEITHGDRIAQLVIAPVVQSESKLVETLPETERGEGGFGSTGVSE